MKLYTREQMIEAFNYGKTLKGFDWIGDMIDSLEAIELPSDSLCINCDESESTHNICMDCIIKIGKENIELPSDEEIDKESEVLYPINKGGSMWMPSRYDIDKNNRQEGFLEGAKWMRDKIQGYNK